MIRSPAIVGASAVHRDVTEQRRAFDVGQRMEAIVESSDDAIIAITLEGVVTSWNPAAERLFGYTTEEIIGKSAETVTPEDRPDEMKDILAKVRAGTSTTLRLSESEKTGRCSRSR
jgi:two-component system, chemotaxis family, CheB/CheR fusion protein